MTVARLAAPAASAAPPQRLLCNGLIAIAGFEALAAVQPARIVAPYLDEVPTRFLLFAQILLSVRYALAPVLAVPALIFALKGRLRAAILALASLLLSAWLLDDTTSFVIHGPELSLSFGGAVVFARHFLFPLCGLAGGRPRLRRPAACACRAIGQTTLFTWVTFVIFAVAMFSNGF
jgi:hypothetical protein